MATFREYLGEAKKEYKTKDILNDVSDDAVEFFKDLKKVDLGGSSANDALYDINKNTKTTKKDLLRDLKNIKSYLDATMKSIIKDVQKFEEY